jgi:predicted deacetylase
LYIIRLDDASEYMDLEKWCKFEKILNNYQIKPIVSIIPNNKDKTFVEKYSANCDFWSKAAHWQNQNFIIGLHGYTHEYHTTNGGFNPVHSRSEFAGVPLEKQRVMLKKSISIMKKNGIFPKVFVAPSHTFDTNTLEALKLETDIRVISDTIARDMYFKDDFYFIPQQMGHVRKSIFKVTTFCYHPNEMSDKDFEILESFIIKNKEKFVNLNLRKIKIRKKDLVDVLLTKLYFLKRKIFPKS